MIKGLMTRKTLDKSIIDKFPKIRTTNEVTQNRMAALKAYIDFAPIKEIKALGIGSTQVLRMYRRAHELHPDGRYWGYRVCESSVVVVERVRAHDSKSTSGEFQSFLFGSHEKLPELRRLIDLARLAATPTSHFHREIFLPFCRNELKLKESDYPLKYSDKGYSSLNRLLKRPISEVVQIVETIEDAASLYSDLMRRLIRHAKPLQICQFDECKIDLAGSVAVRDADGELQFVAFKDATMLLLVDACHPIIWAYIVFFHPVVSQEDMLLFFSEMDEVWQPRPIKPGRRNYAMGAMMPSAAFPQFVGAQPTVLMGDRAKAHKAFTVAFAERWKRGYTLHLGAPHQWWIRCSVEGVFSVIDRVDFHNQENTTGTGPDDPRRAEAFERAALMGFDDADLRGAVSVAITDYLITRHGGRASALQFLKKLPEDDKNYMVRTLPPPVEGGTPVGTLARWMTVCSSSTGNYVEHYAVWRGPALSVLAPGQKVEVLLPHRDVRYPIVYVDGVERGRLVIEARWRTGGPLTYAALVASARSKRGGKHRHFPERTEGDLETAIAKLERSVAGIPKSKQKSPSPAAGLVADIRGEATAGIPAVQSSPPPSDQEQRSESPAASLPPGRKAPLTVPRHVDAHTPELPDEIQRRIKARRLVYLGGDR